MKDNYEDFNKYILNYSCGLTIMDLNDLDKYFTPFHKSNEDIEKTEESIFTPLNLENRSTTFGTLLHYLMIRYFLYLAEKFEELAFLLKTP